MKAKVLPLEEPLKSPIFGITCVYYRVRVWAIFKNRIELIYEDEKKIEYLLLQKVRKKKRKKFYPIGKPPKDPFSFFTAKDIERMIVTSLRGLLMEEEVLEV
jgi:hypothetical protein